MSDQFPLPLICFSSFEAISSCCFIFASTSIPPTLAVTVTFQTNLALASYGDFNIQDWAWELAATNKRAATDKKLLMGLLNTGFGLMWDLWISRISSCGPSDVILGRWALLNRGASTIKSAIQNPQSEIREIRNQRCPFPTSSNRSSIGRI